MRPLKIAALSVLLLSLTGCWPVCEFMCKYTPDAGRIPAQVIEGSWFTRKDKNVNDSPGPQGSNHRTGRGS